MVFMALLKKISMSLQLDKMKLFKASKIFWRTVRWEGGHFGFGFCREGLSGLCGWECRRIFY